ncbi:MAG: lipid-A-disaccharide synthase [Gammaproteobacteria bacterium]|nr:lipid-A-disaccharide synthase [Gammaproteobacteria bacterium]
MPRIGIVAGEPSGDVLAARLLSELRGRCPGLEAVGVGGPQLAAAGCRILQSMDKLAIMGIAEVIGSYAGLVRLRRSLVDHFRGHPPDVFIGVDAPDFNLDLELALHRSGIKTVHYVSPSIWAWRQKRVHKIAHAVDLMLVLFPFEKEYYDRHGIAARYVGHPLADQVPLEPDQPAARRRLGMATDAPVVAILPGSRRAELRRHAAPFLLAADWVRARRGDARFAGAVVDDQAAEFCNAAVKRLGLSRLAIRFHPGRAQDVLEAADVALLASGTVSLEAMLMKRPMVVAYKMNRLTFMILRAMVSLNHVALPNLLAGCEIVPERLQGACRPELLGRDLLRWLERPDDSESVRARFTEIHKTLRKNATAAAAESVLQLMREP